MPLMAFLLDSVGALLISLFSYTLWRFLRPFFVKTALSDIPGPPRSSWLRGNFFQLFDVHGWQFHHDIVEKYGGVVKLHGLLGDEQLFVTDPRALHHVCIKDQSIYEESGVFIATNKMIFGTSLLSTLGDHHRRQRKMLNPVFSVKHIRGLTDIFHSISHELTDAIKRRVENGEEEVDVLEWMSRAALEYIGQGGLGYSFDALDKSKTNVYAESVKMLFPVGFSIPVIREYLPYLIKIGSPSFRRKMIDCVPSKGLREAKRIIDIMDATSRDIFAKKKIPLARGDEEVLRQIGQGKDIMSVLMRANMAADDEDKLPEEELIGQMSTLIFAGHDTTSGALARTLHLLSFRPDVQDRLREEVTAAQQEHGGDLYYDTLMNLPYLDAVCRETLRAYPPTSYQSRTTRKDVVMPLSIPIKSADGKKEITEIFIKKNTTVTINIRGANRSKAIWGEDAEEWKPERWLEPLPESVSEAHLPGVYSSMMTFLGGSRACIGFKFAELEMKVVLSAMLTSFVFSSAKKIYWNMGGLASPVLEGSTDTKPQLPLQVSLVL